MRNHRRAAAMAVVVVVLGASACSSSGDDDTLAGLAISETSTTTQPPASSTRDPESGVGLPVASEAATTTSSGAALDGDGSPDDGPVTGGDGSGAGGSTGQLDAEVGGEPLIAGNPGGGAAVPAEGGALDTSSPDHVIGDGSPASCTSAVVVDAVAAGGVITFSCGPDPVTITMEATAKVVNANGPDIVLDGGGLVTLSGGDQRRILYQNTCDEAQGFTTSHCQNQDHPRLTVQHLTFTGGNATGETVEGGGGGAIFVRGGRLRIVGSRFVANRCDASGPDVGGAAVRVLSQHDDRPVYVVDSTFEGGVCSNGGALSSIGVSWVVLNSVMTGNSAIGEGANPARSGTPGGGSGGAIYTDGNEFTVEITGSRIEGNHANEGGGAVFFVSNNRTGTMSITDSTLRNNPSDGFETSGYPGIFFLGARDPTVTRSALD